MVPSDSRESTANLMCAAHASARIVEQMPGISCLPRSLEEKTCQRLILL
jgi:hypothetical protein